MTLVIVIVAVAAIAYAVSKKNKGQSSVPAESGLSGESHAGDDGLDSFAEFSMNATIADAVVIDTETVNSPSGMRIIDIGAILVRNGAPICEWEQLISPECEIPMSSTLLTGITRDSLASQPKAEQVMPEFIAAISNLTVIGHNVSYDISALNNEASRNRHCRSGRIPHRYNVAGEGEVPERPVGKPAGDDAAAWHTGIRGASRPVRRPMDSRMLASAGIHVQSEDTHASRKRRIETASAQRQTS